MHAQSQLHMDKLQQFTTLLQDHHRDMLIYARSLTKESHHAKDIAQDAFVSAWQNMDVFDVTRDFSAWMRGIIRNKWREWLRKSNKESPIDDETLEYLESTLKDWENLGLAGGPAIFQALENCLKKLPAPMNKAVSIYYKEGHSSDEAAALIGCQPSAFRKRLERARTSLKSCIENQ